MADDKSKPGAPDRKLINLSEDHEVRGWCTKFGVTEAELRKAVWKVGHDAAKVEEHLKNGPEVTMDNATKEGGQDRERINLNQRDEVVEWAEKFGVRSSDVRQAVAAVGDDAARVALYLKHRK